MLYTAWVVTMIVGRRPPLVQFPKSCCICKNERGATAVCTWAFQKVFAERDRPP